MEYTEDQIQAILKLTEELGELLKPYIDALEKTTKLLIDFMLEYNAVKG